MTRVITYIDGFNLYFGMKSAGLDRYLWLDIYALSSSLIKPYQTLEAVRYFTSTVAFPASKSLRQKTYLEALMSLPRSPSIHYGRYQYDERICKNCSHRHEAPSEKMTDVNIAVRMVEDAYLNKFDTAILISGDSDLCPPIDMVRSGFPAKKIVIAFPPDRFSNHLKQKAHAHFSIGRANIAKSQLPETITRGDGFQLKRPHSWNVTPHGFRSTP
jgi:uncharacterized LabA/DUF88 family protein